MSNELSNKTQTSNSFIDYRDNIVFVKLKDDVEITVKSMQEQYKAQENLVGSDRYAVLVDASKNSNATKEAREYMANYNPPNRIATAILTNKNLPIVIMANFYLKVNNPTIPTKLFNKEEDAIEWLKNQLSNF